jgi:Raf kinase inhibitor-like YbhB/YbcL family protein
VAFRIQALWLSTLLISASACTGGQIGEEPTVTVPHMITVRSTAFAEDEPIPPRYTCDGEGQAPPLTWEGVPEDAAVLALLVDDPDAPRGTFTHWVVLDIPATSNGLTAGPLPRGAVEAENSGSQTSYYPPCPPTGVHHYRFTVYALARQTGLQQGARLEQAMRAVESTATAQGRLVGVYERPR